MGKALTDEGKAPYVAQAAEAKHEVKDYVHATLLRPDYGTDAGSFSGERGLVGIYYGYECPKDLEFPLKELATGVSYNGGHCRKNDEHRIRDDCRAEKCCQKPTKNKRSNNCISCQKSFLDGCDGWVREERSKWKSQVHPVSTDRVLAAMSDYHLAEHEARQKKHKAELRKIQK